MTPIKVSVFVLLPTKEHPKFNFVGKLLGPGGNSLKRLQSDSQTKMAIQGRGSVRDKDKEEEQRQSNEPKYLHLKEDLHLKIEAYAPAEEAYARIASAIREVQPFLIPEIHDAISQGQMTQMSSGGRGRGRGDGRRGGRGESHGRPVSYYDREMAPASRGYDEYRGRDPYASSSAEAYDRAEPRSQPRDYYDSYSQPRSIESRRDAYGEYPTSRQASWAGQGNGYGKSAAPRGGRGSDRAHPYGRGGRPAAY